MMRSDREILTLEQTLHGYSRGHRKLSSSIQIDRVADKALHELSDMSGPNMQSGFEHYLTAYPLPMSDFYAFGMTWYAHEMERPGCVWTHTLLLKRTDIEALEDMSVLIPLFRRPTDEYDADTYREPLHLPLDLGWRNGASKSFLEGSLEIVEDVCAALYDSPQLPVYIAVDENDQFTSLLLEMWNQQWPELRASFAFCTGALADRKVSDRSFDLQIIPMNRVSQFRRTIRDARHIVPGEPVASSDRSWVRATAEDIMGFQGTALRKFLKTYGDDTGGGRSSFVSLVDTYHLLSESHRVDSKALIEYLAKHFPHADEARRLKTDVLAPRAHSHPWSLQLTSNEILLALATVQKHSAFEPEVVKLSKHMEIVAGQHSNQIGKFIEVLIQSKLNPLGDIVLQQLSIALSVEQAIGIVTSNPHLAYVILQGNLSVAASPDLWSANRNRAHELFEIATVAHNDPDSSCQIVWALLGAKLDTLATEVSTTFEKQSVAWILDWHNRESSGVLGEQWLNILRYNSLPVVEWLQKTSRPQFHTLLLIADIINPNLGELKTISNELWIDFLAAARDKLSDSLLVQPMSFLFTLGTYNYSEGSASLVSGSFDILHEAAMHNRLPTSSWLNLSKRLPKIRSWSWTEWDKAERLRGGLVKSYIENQWPIQEFLNATSSPATFERIIKLCLSKKSTKKFIKLIAQGVAHEIVKADKDKKQLLSKILKSF